MALSPNEMHSRESRPQYRKSFGAGFAFAKLLRLEDLSKRFLKEIVAVRCYKTPVCRSCILFSHIYLYCKKLLSHTYSPTVVFMIIPLHDNLPPHKEREGEMFLRHRSHCLNPAHAVPIELIYWLWRQSLGCIMKCAAKGNSITVDVIVSPLLYPAVRLVGWTFPICVTSHSPP